MKESDEVTKRRGDGGLNGIAAVLLGLALTVTVAAQEQTEPQAPPDTPPTDTPDPQDEQEETPATLDELLGLEEDASDRNAEEAAERESEDELQRKLDEAEIGDVFAKAVEKMLISADLLDQSFDPGLGTQRVQEDILRKLDQLIDFAKRQQGMSSSSSSSSSSSQQQPKDPSQDPGRRQRDQQSGSQRQNGPADDSQAKDLPPGQTGDIGTILEETRSEWGHLPPRIRDQLLQGRREKYSSLYERLTREYYQRLAEEGSE